MTPESSATHPARHPIPSRGLAWGLLGVLAFSFTLPFTRIATTSLDPLFVGAGRAVVAATLAALALAATRQRFPRGREWASLVVIAAGVVAGFPLLTSFALTTSPASHGAVVIALLPAATAVAAVLRTGERPPRSFWVFAGLGAIAAVGFATLSGGGLGGVSVSDLLLFGAVIAAAVGYAEGGVLARRLGSWQTVSWALIVASPVMVALTAASALHRTPSGGPAVWASFAYLAAVSMFLGFFAWYRGLAIGPMAQVSQVQLVQPVLTIGWSALILHEPIDAATALGALAVVGSAALAVRTRTARRSADPRIDQGSGKVSTSRPRGYAS